MPDVEKKDTRNIGFRADLELCAQIEAAAERNRRSTSNFIRCVLLEYLEATANSGDEPRAV